MSVARTTIIVSPREQFCVARRSLDSIYDHTETPFDLVYVDAGSPRELRRWLDRESVARGFRLLRSSSFLTPNEARNWALEHVQTELIAFVDNDLLVTPGWLAGLIECADATGATAVGPLILEGEPEDGIIHMAGGACRFEGEAPKRSFHTSHLLQKRRVSQLGARLERAACDFVEFHCLLVRRDAFDRLGPLDEGLLNTREHLDLCLQIHAAGGSVFFEPASVVTYKSPPPLELADIPFFLRRWCDDWTIRSLEHFIAKYGLDPAYLKRAEIAAARREVVFLPVVGVVERMLGMRAAGAVRAMLRAVERASNRLLLRGAPRLAAR
jgi:glycosyltransferase involved in cell wall biosynthesis